MIHALIQFHCSGFPEALYILCAFLYKFSPVPQGPFSTTSILHSEHFYQAFKNVNCKNGFLLCQSSQCSFHYKLVCSIYLFADLRIVDQSDIFCLNHIRNQQLLDLRTLHGLPAVVASANAALEEKRFRNALAGVPPILNYGCANPTVAFLRTTSLE